MEDSEPDRRSCLILSLPNYLNNQKFYPEIFYNSLCSLPQSEPGYGASRITGKILHVAVAVHDPKQLLNNDTTELWLIFPHIRLFRALGHNP
jgi:hypothetical protein